VLRRVYRGIPCVTHRIHRDTWITHGQPDADRLLAPISTLVANRSNASSVRSACHMSGQSGTCQIRVSQVSQSGTCQVRVARVIQSGTCHSEWHVSFRVARVIQSGTCHSEWHVSFRVARVRSESHMPDESGTCQIRVPRVALRFTVVSLFMLFRAIIQLGLWAPPKLHHVVCQSAIVCPNTM
jgi:hypothetical protein